MKSKKGGFTIVELIIVIAIIGILAAVLVPVFSSVLSNAHRTADVQMMHRINAGLVSGEIEKSQLGDYKPQTKGWQFAYSETRNEVVIIDENGNIVAAWDDALISGNADENGYSPVSNPAVGIGEPGEPDMWKDAYVVESELNDNNKETLKSMTEIYLSDKVTEIPDGYFKNFKKLERIYLGKEIKAIPASAFSNCTALREVYIAGELTEIGANGFVYCDNLSSINLDFVVTIGANAFNSCGFEKLTLPATLKSICTNSFAGCEFTDLSMPCVEIVNVNELSTENCFSVVNWQLIGGTIDDDFGSLIDVIVRDKLESLTVRGVDVTATTNSPFRNMTDRMKVTIDSASYELIVGRFGGNPFGKVLPENINKY